MYNVTKQNDDQELDQSNQFLIFSNPGELDHRLITTMGLSIKSENAIGYYGTGLKYAIAGVLRLGGKIGIYSGKTWYGFTSVESEIKGYKYSAIKMTNWGEFTEDENYPHQSQILGFTTDLGKTWESWMYYREFWSNSRDEGGTEPEIVTELSDEVLANNEGKTLIVIQCDELINCHNEKNKFILSSSPIYKSDLIEIHSRNNLNSTAVFYQGLKVFTYDLKEKPCYTYNILTKLALTEDRQASRYAVELAIARAIMQWQDHDNIKPLETIILTKTGCEAAFDWNWASTGNPSRIFLQVVADLRRQGKLDRISTVVKYSSRFKDYNFAYAPCPPTPEEQAALNLAKVNMMLLGHPIEFEIKLSEDVNEDDLLQIINNVIYIAPSMTKDVYTLTKRLLKVYLSDVKNLYSTARETFYQESWMAAVGILPEPKPETQTKLETQNDFIPH